jgi:hypothetical protein
MHGWVVSSSGRPLHIIGEAQEASPNVLVVPLAGQGGRGMVLVEYERKPGSVTLPHPMTDLLTGKRLKGCIELAPYSVMVLKDLAERKE